MESNKTKGRAINPNSKRQQKLAAQAEAKANGTEIKRGRNADPTSKRQQKLANKATAIANGTPIQRGRPTKVKVDA